jgi:heat shock protein HslJ
MRKATVVVCVVAMLAVGGCGDGDEASGDRAGASTDSEWQGLPPTEEDLGGNLFVVQSVTIEGEPQPFVTVDPPPSIEFGDPLVASDGCNGVTGRYDVADDGSFTVSDTRISRRGCDGALGRQANYIQSAIVDGGDLSIAEDILRLTSHGVDLRLKRALPEPP